MSIGHVRLISAIALALWGSAAWGAADDEVAVQSNDKRPALYLTTGDQCLEDYADELIAAGLDVKITRFQTLTSIGRITQVPPDVRIDHLLLVGGYVIANHVGPEVILGLVATKPAIRGLVGPAGCATAGDHEGIHSERARSF